jgi:hypothetical protein
MKRIISVAAMFMVMLFTSSLFGQVEIKSTSTTKDSDKKTETKTNQKVNMGGGGYTKNGTQVNPPAGTQDPAKTPSGVAEPGTEKSLPPAAGKIIYDRLGEVMATVGADGKIYDTKGNVLAQYTAKGEYFGPDGQMIGSIRDGVIKTKDGKEAGKLSKDGKVSNAKGKLLGTIYDDGTIRNSKGSRLGSAPGVDKNIAAMIFFNKKKPSSDAKKPNTEKKPAFESKPIEKN